MRRRPSLVLTTLTVLGCGSTAATPQAEAPTIEPSQNQPSQAAQTAALVVHEWGLIDVYSDGQIEIAAGPGSADSRPPQAPMPMRKPVVYFHLDPSVDHLDFNVDVRIAGTMLETWPTPTTQTGLDHIAWQGTVQHCGANAPTAAVDPSVRYAREHCATRDSVCEVIDLPTYETSDGDCVSVGAQQGRLLFYRGELAQATTFPLTITQSMHAEPGLPVISALPTITLSSALEHPVFFVNEGSGAILHPQLGEATTLPASNAGARPNLPRADSLLQPFTAELVNAGLSQDEARAFMAAWSDSLFGTEASTRRGPAREVRGVTPPESTLLYFLPREDIERLAPMQITPTPRRLERVMVVRLHIAI